MIFRFASFVQTNKQADSQYLETRADYTDKYMQITFHTQIRYFQWNLKIGNLYEYSTSSCDR